MSSLFKVEFHPHIDHRTRLGAPKTGDSLPHLPTDPWYTRFNTTIAVNVTRGVGTMWAAWAFCLLSLVSLPGAIASHSAVVMVSWISQTFLQLTLLAVLQLGQNLQSTAADKRSQATYDDATAILSTTTDIQKHLEAQDEVIVALKSWVDDQSKIQ